MDPDQTNAFLLCARQTVERELFRKKLTDKKPDQLILYLGGEGGTGKSAVLRALTAYMTSLGVRHQMRLASQTGVAAGNIRGSTLHSLLKLPTTKKQREKAMTMPETVITNFKAVTLFFIDEISMTGCCDLNLISNRLKNAKGNEDEPFGGVDMIFAGDFYQLPPNSSDPLFRKVNLSDSSCTVNTTKAGLGYVLFRQCTHAIFLKTQHRIIDERYKSFVNNFRKGEADYLDEKYLKGLVIDKENTLRRGHLAHLKEDPLIIVMNNELRYYINNVKAKQHALALGEKLLLNVANDKSKTSVSSKHRRSLLLKSDGPATNYLAGLLPLFRGMVVMVKKNFGTEIGISNGTTGVITEIVLDPREMIDYRSDEPHFLRFHPVSIYVKVDSPWDKRTNAAEIRFQLSGLPPNVFMMTRDQVKTMWAKKVTMSAKELQAPFNIVVHRQQFEILPAYCITVNASQGRTLESAVVNLEGNFKDNVKQYVMLSRLTNGSSLGVIGGWNHFMWKKKPNADMLHYDEVHLKPLELRTIQNLDNGLLKDFENLLRNQ